jgi:hypothetical protein
MQHAVRCAVCSRQYVPGADIEGASLPSLSAFEVACFASLSITIPSVSSDLLILHASWNWLPWLIAPLLFTCQQESARVNLI